MFATTYPRITVATAIALAAALLPSGAAAADPNQDDQFLAVLESKQIPAMDNVATVVAAGHTVCHKLDDGMSAQEVLAGLTGDAFEMNPELREQSARLSVTMSRFIAASVEVYCPDDQSKITALTVGRVRGSDRLFTLAAYRAPRAPRAPGDIIGVLGSPGGTIATGDTPPTNPPQVPSPKVPKAKTPRTPRVVTKPTPPQQLPPTPAVQPPPPPEVQPPPPPEVQPPAPPDNEPIAGGPQPGNGPGAPATTGGTGANDGAGSPAGPPPPAQPRSPGMIQLVPWGDN